MAVLASVDGAERTAATLREAAREMIKQRSGGTIVNLSSVHWLRRGAAPTSPARSSGSAAE